MSSIATQQFSAGEASFVPSNTWPQPLWGERSFADSFPYFHLLWKCGAALNTQAADLPCKASHTGEVNAKNLAFSTVHPEPKQI